MNWLNKLISGDPNSRDKEGRTPLIVAVYQRNADMVRYLLERGADANAQWTRTGTTALMLAADFGLPDIASMLLSRGADPNKVDGNYWTALMMAARKGHLQITNLLLDNGAQPDMTNIDGSTALMYAVEARKADVIKSLLLRGSDVEIKNDLGFSAVTICEEHGFDDIRRLILEHIDPLQRQKYERGEYEKPPLSLRELNRCPRCGYGFAFEKRPPSGTVYQCENCGHLIILTQR